MTLQISIARPVEWRTVGVTCVGKHATVQGEFTIEPDDASGAWHLTLKPYDLGMHTTLQRAREHAQRWVDVGVLSNLSSVALHAMTDRIVTMAEINPGVFGDLARVVTDFTVSEARPNAKTPDNAKA